MAALVRWCCSSFEHYNRVVRGAAEGSVGVLLDSREKLSPKLVVEVGRGFVRGLLQAITAQEEDRQLVRGEEMVVRQQDSSILLQESSRVGEGVREETPRVEQVMCSGTDGEASVVGEEQRLEEVTELMEVEDARETGYGNGVSHVLAPEAARKLHQLPAKVETVRLSGDVREDELAEIACESPRTPLDFAWESESSSDEEQSGCANEESFDADDEFTESEDEYAGAQQYDYETEGTCQIYSERHADYPSSEEVKASAQCWEAEVGLDTSEEPQTATEDDEALSDGEMMQHESSRAAELAPEADYSTLRCDIFAAVEALSEGGFFSTPDFLPTPILSSDHVGFSASGTVSEAELLELLYGCGGDMGVTSPRVAYEGARVVYEQAVEGETEISTAGETAGEGEGVYSVASCVASFMARTVDAGPWEHDYNAKVDPAVLHAALGQDLPYFTNVPVLGNVGKGGMGTVHRVYAEDGSGAFMNCALKCVAPKPGKVLHGDEQLQEALHLLACQGPHVLPLEGYALQEGNLALLFKMADAPPDFAKRGASVATTPHEIYRRLRYLHQAVLGLAWVHGRRVVHRDIKPGNFLFVDGVTVIGDFGIAISFDEAFEGGTPGTDGYRAPETLEEGFHTPESDVWAMGATIWAIMTGRRPAQDFLDGDGNFDEEKFCDHFWKVGQFAWPAEFLPCGQAVADLVAHSCTRFRHARPTAQELADKVEALVLHYATLAAT